MAIDLLLGSGKDTPLDDWVQCHQRRLRDAYEMARAQLIHEADDRKRIFDRHAKDLPLAAVEIASTPATIAQKGATRYRMYGTVGCTE